MLDTSAQDMVEESIAALDAGFDAELLVAGEWHQIKEFGPAKEGLFIANLKDGATLITGGAHVQAVRYRSSNNHNT
jgi:hypothetical protein